MTCALSLRWRSHCFPFGEDAQGELYICSSNGQVYRINKSRGNPAR